MAFVRIDHAGNDRFCILPWVRFRDIIVDVHESCLAKRDGTRPKKWDSLHSAIMESRLEPYRDRWDTFEKSLR